MELQKYISKVWAQHVGWSSQVEKRLRWRLESKILRSTISMSEVQKGSERTSCSPKERKPLVLSRSSNFHLQRTRESHWVLVSELSGEVHQVYQPPWWTLCSNQHSRARGLESGGACQADSVPPKKLHIVPNQSISMVIWYCLVIWCYMQSIGIAWAIYEVATWSCCSFFATVPGKITWKNGPRDPLVTRTMSFPAHWMPWRRHWRWCDGVWFQRGGLSNDGMVETKLTKAF